ncbi:hypothetical protein [Frigidibacter oleivorans]|uniref:hypothetical protein n=1 Tax=Frigidibacter oleivorans TaxID=2487129 RepID=UPI000F8E4389|nr:hypothetical protein [Frigidibacter oleivorans]
MKKLIGLFLHLFKTPSAYPDDAEAWAGNQCAHAVIFGMAPAAILAAIAGDAIAILTVFIVYGIWEAAQVREADASPSDGLADLGFVTLGAWAAASAVVGNIPAFLLCIITIVLLVLSGVLARLR